METGDEISVLFILNYLLELQRKSMTNIKGRMTTCDLRLTPLSLRPHLSQLHPRVGGGAEDESDHLICRKLLTLMMTKSVDWKSDGFDAGSKMEALDWKD